MEESVKDRHETELVKEIRETNTIFFICKTIDGEGKLVKYNGLDVVIEPAVNDVVACFACLRFSKVGQ